ncbi:MAG: hypothetical protein AAFV53_32590 [Myxococcota bacterium]
MALIEEYPLGGVQHAYRWVPGEHTDGVSRSLLWGGQLLATPDAEKTVHCSGITFEVYLRALRQHIDESAVTAEQLLALKSAWYIREGAETGPVDALVSRGLGRPVDDFRGLIPGDFVQFWRNNGNGHSCIFIKHTHRRDGSKRGVMFWSAQSSSYGLGYRYISEGTRPDQFSPGKLYGVRAAIVQSAGL